MPTFDKRLNIASEKQSDISDLIGIGGFLSGEVNRYLEGSRFRYKYSSVIENKPTHWYTKNNTWRDVNKWYNQYTGNRDIALKKAVRFQTFGRAVFIGGVFLSSFDLVGGVIERDLNRSLKGGLGIGVSIVSLYLPVVGWIYTGYMLLDLIGAFDRPIIQPIRKDPYIIEADSTRIVKPPIN